jgi:hypothetical protein
MRRSVSAQISRSPDFPPARSSVWGADAVGLPASRLSVKARITSSRNDHLSVTLCISRRPLCALEVG